MPGRALHSGKGNTMPALKDLMALEESQAGTEEFISQTDEGEMDDSEEARREE